MRSLRSNFRKPEFRLVVLLCFAFCPVLEVSARTRPQVSPIHSFHRGLNWIHDGTCEFFDVIAASRHPEYSGATMRSGDRLRTTAISINNAGHTNGPRTPIIAEDNVKITANDSMNRERPGIVYFAFFFFGSVFAGSVLFIALNLRSKGRTSERDLAQVMRANTIAVLGITLSGILMLFVWQEIVEFQSSIKNARTELIEQKKVILTERINRVLRGIKSIQSAQPKEEDPIIQSNRDKVLAHIQERAANDGDDYIFIIDTSGKMIFHPERPALEGTDISHYEDLNWPGVPRCDRLSQWPFHQLHLDETQQRSSG